MHSKSIVLHRLWCLEIDFPPKFALHDVSSVVCRIGVINDASVGNAWEREVHQTCVNVQPGIHSTRWDEIGYHFVYVEFNNSAVRGQRSCVVDRDIVSSTHVRDTHFSEIFTVFIEDFDDPTCGVDVPTLFIDIHIDAFPKHGGTVVWIRFLRGCVANGFLNGVFVCFTDEVVRESGSTASVSVGIVDLRILSRLHFGR